MTKRAQDYGVFSTGRPVQSRRIQPLAEDFVSVDLLERCARDWLHDCQSRMQAEGSIGDKRRKIDKLIWFLRTNSCDVCGPSELRAFFAYLTRAHIADGCRFGNVQLIRPLRPITVKNYHVCFRTLFDWVIADGYMSVSPFARLTAPKVALDQVEVFSESQVAALLGYAARSHHAERDLAILMLMLETGLRASEVCGLTMVALDAAERSLHFVGKGGKSRTVYLGRDTYRQLYRYMNEIDRQAGDHLFTSDRGGKSGGPLTRSGLYKIFRRLGKSAGLARCHPHMLRRTYAVFVLREGGNVFTLRESMGHTSLTMTDRYVRVAQADVAAQTRLHSPVGRVRKWKAGGGS